MKINSFFDNNNSNDIVNNDFFAKRFLKKYIGNLDYLPRWIIFSIDVLILLVANAMTYALIKALNIEFYPIINTPLRFGIVIMVNIMFFLVLRTYSGIIRHSSFIDVLKLLLSTGLSLLLLLTFHYGTYFLYDVKIYVVPFLFINSTITFVLLFLFRIFVKKLFEIFKRENSTSTVLKALVYGADGNAIFVANALKSEIPSRFKLVGFINKSQNKSSKTIYGLPIVDLKRSIPVLMRSMGANALILADKSLTIQEKTAIVDLCLDFNLKVFTLPAITDWEDASEISQKVKKIEIADLLERNPIVLDNKLISQQVKCNTVLISGAAGSIGSEIVWQILSFQPKTILIVDQAETPLHHLSLELSKNNTTVQVHSIIADIRDLKVMEAVFQKYEPTIVYHAAAYKHVPLMEENPAQAIFTNVRGTKNLADLSIKYKVERFVMVSTDKAVNPSNVMGASKRIAEKYVQSLFYRDKKDGLNGTKFITTRFGNVLGSNGSVVPLFTKQIAAGGPITITHPDIIRYFMTIPEACQLVLEAGAMGNGGEIYIFDMGKPVKIIDLARKMIKLAGFVPEEDIEIKIVGLRPGEKLYEELLNDESKTVPTHHEKIMIAEEDYTDCAKLHHSIEELLLLAGLFNNEALVSKMKEIVPEFKSMNSTYELLDKV